MDLDLSPKLDFHGRMLPVGTHHLYLIEMAPPRNMFRLRNHPNSETILRGLVEWLQRDGWDVRRMPSDPYTNPYGDKIEVTIHMKDGQISKQP